MKNAVKNTDREIWRLKPDDYYSPSIHVTENNDIGIKVGGYVLVAPVKEWFKAGERVFTVNEKLPNWQVKLAYWLMKWK